MKKTSGFDQWLQITLKKDKQFRKDYRSEFAELPLSTQLKILRRQEGLSQTALARKTGRPQPEIARMEQPGYNMKINTLKRIVGALNAKIAILPYNVLE